MWPSLLIRTCYWYFLGSAIGLWQEYHLWKKPDVSLLCTTELAAIITHGFYKSLLQELGIVILQKKCRLRAGKFSFESPLERQSWEWDMSPTVSQPRYLHGRMSLLTNLVSEFTSGEKFWRTRPIEDCTEMSQPRAKVREERNGCFLTCCGSGASFASLYVCSMAYWSELKISISN